MGLFIIEDKLTRNSDDYFFSTESINNLIVSKLFVSKNNKEKSLIKKIEKNIINLETTQEEMMLFHNKILSSFFQALRNKDTNPENSMENIEFENSANMENKQSVVVNDNLLQKYIDSLIDLNIIAILISQDENIEYSINNSLDEDILSDIKSSMEFSHRLMLSQRENISKIIGNINHTILLYNDYIMLYYEIDGIFIIIVTSTVSNLAQSIKIANITRDKIIDNLF